MKFRGVENGTVNATPPSGGNRLGDLLVRFIAVTFTVVVMAFIVGLDAALAVKFFNWGWGVIY